MRGRARGQSTTLRFAALVFLLQSAAAVGLIGVMTVVLQAEVRSEAIARGDMLRDELLQTFGQSGRSALVRMVRLRSETAIAPGSVLLLVDQGGRKLAGSLSRWPDGVRLDGRHVENMLYRVGGTTPEAMLVRATRLPSGDRLLTGSVVEGERRVMQSLAAAGALGLALAILFAAVAAWLTARMITARLRLTIETLEVVRGGDLRRRVPGDASTDAFASLSRSVNAMLDRVETLVDELKIATDGLAHDLKSPLSRLRSSLERAALVAQEPEAQAAIDAALADGQRLLSIVETALRISRAEAGVGRDSFIETDLALELGDLAEIYGPVIEEAGRAIVVDIAGPVTMPVQRELLGQALSNLIDNALKDGAGTITLGLRTAPDMVALSVADQGAGIPVEQRAQALKRFGRLDQARQRSGAGLGLTLVAAVARLHGGALTLGDAAPGLIATITLPIRAGSASRSEPEGGAGPILAR